GSGAVTLDGAGAGAAAGAPLVVQRNSLGAEIGVPVSAVAAGVPTRPMARTEVAAAAARIERVRIPGLLVGGLSPRRGRGQAGYLLNGRKFRRLRRSPV